jgi:hypothetical protein
LSRRARRRVSLLLGCPLIFGNVGHALPDAAEIAKEFPDVTWDKMLVDAMVDVDLTRDQSLV